MEEALPSLLAAAVASHELFTSFLDAGFTEQQSLYLVGVILATNAQQKGLDT